MHHGWLVIAGFLSLGVALFHVPLPKSGYVTADSKTA
jgi:hypothetical protein